jgi:hypothetical protein
MDDDAYIDTLLAMLRLDGREDNRNTEASIATNRHDSDNDDDISPEPEEACVLCERDKLFTRRCTLKLTNLKNREFIRNEADLIGVNCSSAGNRCLIEGDVWLVTGNFNVCIVNNSKVIGHGNVVIGHGNSVTGIHSVALGRNIKFNGTDCEGNHRCLSNGATEATVGDPGSGTFIRDAGDNPYEYAATIRASLSVGCSPVPARLARAEQAVPSPPRLTDSPAPQSDKPIARGPPMPPKRKKGIVSKCMICYDERAVVVMLPCGHINACPKCAPALKNKPCANCRRPVTGIVTTYDGGVESDDDDDDDKTESAE